jgi:hypothetical protein
VEKAEFNAEEHPQQAGRGITEVAGFAGGGPGISTTSRPTVLSMPWRSASAASSRATRTPK